VGGLLGGGGGGTSGNTGTNATAQKSIDLGKFQENPAVQSGLDTLQGPKGYLQAALGGSQERLQGLLGPEVSTVLSQYDNAARAATELGPRGGGRTAVLAEAPFKKAAAYGQQLAGAKAGAVKDLSQIGEAEAGIGGAEEQRRNAFKEAQGQLNLGQNKIQFEGAQAKNKAYGEIGSGIGDILTRIIAGKKAGGGGGGSTFGSSASGVGAGIDPFAFGSGGE